MKPNSHDEQIAYHMLNSYPTNSLKEYLAYQSVHCSEEADSQFQAIKISDIQNNFQIQVDIGDGRSEVIFVNEKTDIKQEANNFCEKHGLDGYIAELLAETIREKYERQKVQAQHKQLQDEIQSVREIYTNSHTREVLLTLNDSTSNLRKKQRGDKDAQLKTAQSRGACKLLSNYYSRTKRHSMAETISEQQIKQYQLQMNRVSQQICNKLGKQNIIDYRNHRSREKLHILKKEKQLRQSEEMKQCIFKPKINMISKIVDGELIGRGEVKEERYELLYRNYQNIQNKKEINRKKSLLEIPFKPTINLISQKIVEDRKEMGLMGNSYSGENSKKCHANCSYDQNTSLPHTGRKPRNRNTENLPIGDYLYNKAMKKNKANLTTCVKPIVKANQHSDYLISILKQKRLNQIFTDLTVPPHQQLSSEDIKLSLAQFKFGINRHFLPIFNEMIELDVALTRQQFVEASLRLFKTLTPQQKHEIIFKKQQEPSPTIENSRSLVNNKSRELLLKYNYEQTDIYSRGILRRRNTEDNVEKSRERKARQELKVCTFKPIISRNV